ncbi:MAG: hypothetical protein SFT92_02225 [Rickettsiales bacterium]|nr:hypothetical protein [Rickettsiales bacterium]
MFFKVHLLIISVVIIITYFVWQFMAGIAVQSMTNKAPAAKTVQQTSGYQVIAVNASWGLNCKKSLELWQQETGKTYADYENYAKSFAPNNVLEAVKFHCNGKQICQFDVNDQSLGPDPAPSCMKELSIVYRCFSYDRAKSLVSHGEPVTINCAQPGTP